MTAKRILVYLLITISFLSCDPDERKGNIAYKPNIYIYPTETIQLDVLISFPLEGNIINSIPAYGNG